jgi:hypothetical protein
MGISISKSRILICEGASDQAFFRALIRSRNLPEFDIFKPEDLSGVSPGKDGFKPFLEGISVVLPSTRVAGILVVADNDLDPAASFANVQRQIRNARGGYGVPSKPLEVAKPDPAVSIPPLMILMLPWEGEMGALESLLLQSVYGNQPNLKTCSDTFCHCTATDTWDQVKQSKMRIQAALAAMCRSNPDVPLQGAWNQDENLIPLNHAAFDRISTLLAGFDAALT